MSGHNKTQLTSKLLLMKQKSVNFKMHISNSHYVRLVFKIQVEAVKINIYVKNVT